MLHFYTPWKHQKTLGFLKISGEIDVQRWFKMRWYNKYLTWISSKLNVKNIAMSNTTKLHDKRSTKNSEVSFS